MKSEPDFAVWIGRNGPLTAFLTGATVDLVDEGLRGPGGRGGRVEPGEYGAEVFGG